jgi:hypothetical protein
MEFFQELKKLKELSLPAVAKESETAGSDNSFNSLNS